MQEKRRQMDGVRVAWEGSSSASLAMPWDKEAESEDVDEKGEGMGDE